MGYNMAQNGQQFHGQKPQKKQEVPAFSGTVPGPGYQTPAQAPAQPQPSQTTDPIGSAFSPDSQRYSEGFFKENAMGLKSRPGADFLQQSNAFDTLSTPGQYQQYYDQNASSFGAPGAGAQYWEGLNGAQNQFTQGYQGGNNAQAAFDQFNQAIPGSIQPQFDAAYDRALDKGVSRMNTEAGARGSYGSSAALTGVGGVIADVEAARAKEASNFALADSENQRAWQQGVANAARGADLTGLSAFDSGAGAMTQFGDLSLGVGKERLQRDEFVTRAALDAQQAQQDRIAQGAELAFGQSEENIAATGMGYNLATGADVSYRDRSKQAMKDQLNYADLVFGGLTPQLQGVVSGDQQLQEAIWGGDQAAAIQAQQNQSANRLAGENSVKQALDIAAASQGIPKVGG
jgi:hypothetical protein